MSHIYQPLMLIEILKGNGKTNGRDIAKSFLSYDEPQIDYYKKITTQMPFKYLSKHLNEIKRDKQNYYFEDFDLDEDQTDELVKLCFSKLKKYIEKRGAIFLSTPFSRKAVDRLVKFKVKAFKIGSGECNNYPLVDYIASFRKPIIISTGMNNINSIEIYKELSNKLTYIAPIIYKGNYINVKNRNNDSGDCNANT